jgi:hypothetical protein
MLIRLRDDFLRELNKIKFLYQEKIDTGRLSLEDYRFISGKNLGIKEAENVLQELIRKLFDERELKRKE